MVFQHNVSKIIKKSILAFTLYISSTLFITLAYGLNTDGSMTDEETVKYFGLNLTVKEAKKLAIQGDINAQIQLGQRYTLGIGVKENLIEAEKWLLKAANQNDPFAQGNLGFLYLSHKIRNTKKAIKWIRKSAENGYVIAQDLMGLLYSQGLKPTLSKNYKDALKWYKLAARNGHVSAMRSIGNLYKEGQDIKKDPVKAYAWLTLAIQQGSFLAKKNSNNLNQLIINEQISLSKKSRDDLISFMTNKQISDSERLLKEISKTIKDKS